MHTDTPCGTDGDFAGFLVFVFDFLLPGVQSHPVLRKDLDSDADSVFGHGWLDRPRSGHTTFATNSLFDDAR